MINPSHWAADHVERIRGRTISELPCITDADVIPVKEGVGFWDAWPVQQYDGVPAKVSGGREVWMALGAPRADDPDERHQHARIHLLQRCGKRWEHLGPAMPDGFSPGSREWSGSAVLNPHDMTVTLYFTAAGRRGEAAPSFEQRLFAADAKLVLDDGGPRLMDWRALREIVALDPRHYMPTDRGIGEVGKIKAFRDPAFFLDPTTDHEYLFFAGSIANSTSAYNGAVGVARRESRSSRWELCPPVVSADGLNNELERPHVIRHADLYYLFWSTQRHVFEPACARGPTGLYGMVSSNLLEGWRPLNGTGLVFANPESAPAQAYSWLVLPDLSVASFVDNWGGGAVRRFGGTFAPFVRLSLSGDEAWLQGPA